MRTASEAKRATKASEDRIYREKAAAKEKKREEDRKRLEWAKKTLLPEYWTGLKKAVDEAIHAGRKDASYTISWSAEHELGQILVDRMKKLGYSASYHIRKWDGDIDYPGGSSTDITVSW